MKPFVIFVCLLSVINGARADSQAADIRFEDMRRLYDFTPVSAANPIIARTRDNQIEIPVSEFRAYATGELHGSAKAADLPLAERKRLLQDLIDEHLWLAEGYRLKADQTPGLVATLRNTQAMLLQETYEQQEIGDKTQTRAAFEERRKKLRDEIFDKTDITVTSDGYAQLKSAARRLNSTAHALEVLARPDANDSRDPVERIPEDVRRTPLAVSKIATVTVGDFLHAYVQIPLLQRPDLEKQEGVIEILKQVLEPSLIVAEARVRGLENVPIVREKMQLNRNILSRLYALDQLTAKLTAEMKGPAYEAALARWYEDHREKMYTFKNRDSTTYVLTLAHDRDRIADDYFLDAQDRTRAEQTKAWRAAHPIEIDEAALAKAPL